MKVNHYWLLKKLLIACFLYDAEEELELINLHEQLVDVVVTFTVMGVLLVESDVS